MLNTANIRKIRFKFKYVSGIKNIARSQHIVLEKLTKPENSIFSSPKAKLLK